MVKSIDFTTEAELLAYVEEHKEESYFLWCFLNELSHEKDEYMVVLEQWAETVLLKLPLKMEDPLPNLRNIFYMAYIFQDEIYDFYGKTTREDDAQTLRLHLFADTYFPYRKLWKPMIHKKRPFTFQGVAGENLVEVPVWPIHAGIIPPGHFRFTCDGEDTLNLEIKLWWKYREIEPYFTKETDIAKLVEASQDIAGDSSAAYAVGFAKNIEAAARITIDEETRLNRVLMIELERIYNHLWTLGALANDVGQSYILNGFLAIRDEVMDLNAVLFGSRVFKNAVAIWNNHKNITTDHMSQIKWVLKRVARRLATLVEICSAGSGIYDRFKDTGIVKRDTALAHAALGVWAKASGIAKDVRAYDHLYNSIDVPVRLWENGDVMDRFMVRADEITDSMHIIKTVLKQLWSLKGDAAVHHTHHTGGQEHKLSDGYYISRTEWHRGEILQIMKIHEWKIVYYKFKDPSFVNRTLLEYAVLNNIIADFPVCNKSFDLSYSGFDI